MDIREKIAKAIYSKYMSLGYCLSNLEDMPYPDYWYPFADAVIAIIREDSLEAGVEEEWRYAIERKPSLLSDEEMVEILTREFRNTQGREISREYFGVSANDRVIAQAQREKDIAFYEGGI